jgi:hypothetical protein
MRRRFGVLKRGALSHTFVWKLRTAVNFLDANRRGFDCVGERSVIHSTKAKLFGEFEMGRNTCGWNECFRQGRLVGVLDTSEPFRK